MGIIKEIIYLIEESCIDLLELNTEKFNESSNKVIKKCFEVFPLIISKYADSRLSDIALDALYWPSQLKKMVDCISKDDSILIFDVFYNETRGKLIELSKVLFERNITF